MSRASGRKCWLGVDLCSSDSCPEKLDEMAEQIKAERQEEKQRENKKQKEQKGNYSVPVSLQLTISYVEGPVCYRTHGIKKRWVWE